MINDTRILWIEDDADIIEDVVTPIKKAGIKIDIIASFEDFKNLGKEELNKYKLIILDLILPEDDSMVSFDHLGLEIIRIIRTDWLSNIPVIVLTVVQNDKSISKLQKYNPSSILYKPVRSQVLKDAVIKVIERIKHE